MWRGRALLSTQARLLDMVTKLRSETSFSLSLCKKAVVDAGYDYDAAHALLLSMSQSAPTKTRTAVGSNGVIALFNAADSLSLVEISSETDFVALNSDFICSASTIAEATSYLDKTSGPVSLDALPEEILKEISTCQSRFKENIALKYAVRCSLNAAHNEVGGVYIHQRLSDSLLVGKAAAIVRLCSDKPLQGPKLYNTACLLAKQVVALHDQKIDAQKLLDSECMVGSVSGRVGQVLDNVASELSTKVHLKEVFFRTLRGL
jgi:translation elongation factor EF-Ts